MVKTKLQKSPLNPISSYAKFKNKIEKVFLENNNVVSLRLATVFGVSPRMRDDLLVNDFVKNHVMMVHCPIQEIFEEILFM